MSLPHFAPHRRTLLVRRFVDGTAGSHNPIGTVDADVVLRQMESVLPGDGCTTGRIGSVIVGVADVAFNAPIPEERTVRFVLRCVKAYPEKPMYLTVVEPKNIDDLTLEILLPSGSPDPVGLQPLSTVAKVRAEAAKMLAQGKTVDRETLQSWVDDLSQVTA